MQISQISPAVFSAARDWAALGFTRLSGYSNLYSHASWPGLLFRRVSSALQATVFGGVILGDSNREMILASNRSRDILSWNCGHTRATLEYHQYPSPYFVRDDKLGYFKCDAKAVSVLNYSNIPALYTGADPVWTPTWGMAVVTPNSMIGHRKISNGALSPSTINPTWYRELTFGEDAANISLQHNSGGGASYLDPLDYFLVQWCEIPYAKDGADFVKKAVPAMVEYYPPEVRSQMSALMTKVAADPASNPVSPSTFVLTHVKTSALDPGVWGGRPRAIYSRGSRYLMYVMKNTLNPGGSQLASDPTFGDVEDPSSTRNTRRC